MADEPRLVFPEQLSELPSFYANHVTMQARVNEDVTLTLFQIQPKGDEKNDAVAMARVYVTASLARRVIEIMAPAVGLKVTTKDP